MTQSFETQVLAHLGIVAGYVDKLNLVEFLDEVLPKEKGHHVSSGEAAPGHHPERARLRGTAALLLPQVRSKTSPPSAFWAQGSSRNISTTMSWGEPWMLWGRRGSPDSMNGLWNGAFFLFCPNTVSLHSDTTN